MAMSFELIHSRRRFLQSMFSASVVGSLPAGSPAFGYVGSARQNESSQIQVFRVEGQHWTPLQRVASHAPTAFALHPSGQILYVANAVSLYAGLPRGTVEVFSIDRQTGNLSLVQRTPLSLSATQPRTLAVSRSGKYLVVAAYGGGVLNILPIQNDGRVGEVKGIFKELGCGIHAEWQASAHPHTVVFDQAGRFVLASDFGCDHLSTFVLTDRGELRRNARVSLAPGSGPGTIVCHGDGAWLYVLHELKPAVSCHRYRQGEGIIEEQFQYISLCSGSRGEDLIRGDLEIHPDGRCLHATVANKMTVLSIDGVSGALSVKRQFASQPVSLAFLKVPGGHFVDEAHYRLCRAL
jgi:6-phosphogluconolactonase (cycloisomerase 2 family)